MASGAPKCWKLATSKLLSILVYQLQQNAERELLFLLGWGWGDPRLSLAGTM